MYLTAVGVRATLADVTRCCCSSTHPICFFSSFYTSGTSGIVFKCNNFIRAHVGVGNNNKEEEL